MTEEVPIRAPLQQALDDALRPLFGENLEAVYAENERHDQELRDIPVRIETEMHTTCYRVRERAICFGAGRPEEIGYAVTAAVADFHAEMQARIRSAMEAEHADHQRRIEALRTDSGGGSSSSSGT